MMSWDSGALLAKLFLFLSANPPKVLFDARQLVFNWYPVVVCRSTISSPREFGFF